MKHYYYLLVCLLLPFFVLGKNIQTAYEVQVDQPIDESAYIVANTIDIQAPAAGDLTLIGGEIAIRDRLLEDGLLFGGKILIEGLSQQDLRMIGGTVRISESIAGDLAIVGGEVVIDQGVSIGGNLLILGGNVKIKGTVSGSMNLIGGVLQFEGTANGPLYVKGGKFVSTGVVNGPAELRVQEIELGKGARFSQNVKYWLPSGVSDFTGFLSKGGTARFDDDLAFQMPTANWEEMKEKSMIWIRLFQASSGLLLTILISLLLGRFIRNRTGDSSQKVKASMGLGVLTLIGLPIMGLITMATVVAIPVGIIAFSLWIVLAIAAQALAAVLLTYEWKHERHYDWNTLSVVGVAASLFLATRLIALIPIIGPVFNAALAVWGVGYFITLLVRKKAVAVAEVNETDDMV
ncbi:MAG: hypothetical protein HRU40_04915 [Saprospiraceae bacterium]|nr:hypothetical protein [Saprospiraceae bacterium]